MTTEIDDIVRDDPLNNIDGKKPVPDIHSDLSEFEDDRYFIPMPAGEHAEPDEALDIEVPPEIAADPLPAVPTPQPVSLAFNQVADAQRIEPGSWGWLLGGIAAWSGQSGEHASYGWRHRHLITPQHAREIIANICHRHSFYNGAPFREFGYGNGGRPKGWSPELPGDNPDGSHTYITSQGAVVVSGPEAEHFWIQKVFDLFDGGAGIPIRVPNGSSVPARNLAGIIIKYQVANIMGAIRDPSTNTPYPWTYGGRANSRILDTWLQAFKRGAMSPEDFTTGMQFLVNRLLPHYERAPGIDSFGSAPSGMFPVGCFNGLYWILPVMYDAAQILPQKPLKARCMALVKRWSQWALDLELTVPGRGFDMGRFYVPRAEFTAQWPKPLDTIKPLLKPENILFDPWTWEPWSFRASDVAATVTGSPVLEAARDKLFAKHGGNASNKKWMVRAEGREYAS